MPLLGALADLGDYFDLVTTGWACSKDGASDEELEAWFGGLADRAAGDGLSFSRDFNFERLPELFHGIAFLNRPNGERPPEDPTLYPKESTMERRAALRARLEREWGETLSKARRRVEGELDAVAPSWRAEHRRHD